MVDVPRSPGENGVFPATDWAVIFAAGAGEPDAAHPATIRICELYCQPIYHFVRRTWPTKSADEALEATHEFFALRLEKHDIKHLDPNKGLFRNWLCGAVRNFLLQTRRSNARKSEKVTSLDASGPDDAPAFEPRTRLDPWLALEHELALVVLEKALASLELERAARGDAEFVRQVRRLLVPGEGPATHAELECWGLSRETLKVRIYNMRQRLDSLICLELGVPPDDDEARERELAWLAYALALKEEQPCPKSKALPPRRPNEA